MSRGIRDWVSYWDSSHSIYVNARHADVHYRDIAQAIIALLPGPNARVIDYGCGEALHADLVAAQCGELCLCEAGPNLRDRLRQRFARASNIRVIAPDDLPALPAASCDLIVANSVVQYLSRAELVDLLGVWRPLLAPAGRLVIADVIPPDIGMLSDLIALLRYAFAHGFSWRLFSAWRARPRRPIAACATTGISRYAQVDFLALLAAAGYAAERLPRNMEHNQTRMAFVAQLATPASGALK